MTYQYDRLFDAAADRSPFDARRAYRSGDAAPARVYVYDREGRIELAVNLALATGRPLLIRGAPGTGKSSLAASVAAKLRWRYYEHVVSSRTQARDLLWTFDSVQRLSDAQGNAVKDDAAYLTPGALWWALDAASAAAHSARSDPSVRRRARRAVVLVDEIDKADPDVPNDLLVPLGSLRFDYGEVTVKAVHPPLVIITTNQERDLPRAFLRRCVALELEPPLDERLTQIARAHHPDDPDDATLAAILKSYRAVQKRQQERDDAPASIAEFLDAVAACRSLGTQPGDADLWKLVEELTLAKRRDGA
jgi:MoxR-like ATPase